MRHQQVDRRVLLAERDEEVGLLLEVEQLLDRQLARRRLGRRPHRGGHGLAVERTRGGVIGRDGHAARVGLVDGRQLRQRVLEGRRRRRVVPQVRGGHDRHRLDDRLGLGHRRRRRAQLRLVEPVAVRDAVLLAQLPRQRGDGRGGDRQQAQQPRRPVAARLRLGQLRLQLGGLVVLQLVVVLERLDALVERLQLADVRIVDVREADRRARGGRRRRDDRLLHVELEVRHARIEHQARGVRGRRLRRGPGPRLAGAPGIGDDMTPGRRRRRRCVEFVGERHRRALAHDARAPAARRAGAALRGVGIGESAGRRGGRRGLRDARARRGRGIGGCDLRQLRSRRAEAGRIGEHREAARERAVAARVERDFDDRLRHRRAGRDLDDPGVVTRTRLQFRADLGGRQLRFTVVNLSRQAFQADMLARFDADGYRESERLAEYRIGNRATETQRPGLLGRQCGRGENDVRGKVLFHPVDTTDYPIDSITVAYTNCRENTGGE